MSIDLAPAAAGRGLPVPGDTVAALTGTAPAGAAGLRLLMTVDAVAGSGAMR
ncbi:hypothetical protein [Methylobrevis pamukkalensis]|uniref:Uncharacterized protein n=1 Tax=Methylobrevis pamukkalensis TaxID=1439726 RepID=A0A1E3H1A9_9HYPH|nr:hypothetical protein A6302_02592 [Methylobrevis pamukkalensis]